MAPTLSPTEKGGGVALTAAGSLMVLDVSDSPELGEGEGSRWAAPLRLGDRSPRAEPEGGGKGGSQ